MAKTVIPSEHYFTRPTLAQPKVFNRVWNDINEAFNKLWDGAIVCTPETPFAVLDQSDTITPSSVQFSDATMWPASISTVTLGFTLESGIGSISEDDTSKGGYATWTPPGTPPSYTGFNPTEVKVKMTATYQAEYLAQEEFTISYTNEKTFTVAHAIKDPSDVTVFIDGVEVETVNHSGGGSSVTIVSDTAIGEVVALQYTWVTNDVKEAISSFLLIPAAASGLDAIEIPIPQISTANEVVPLSIIGGSPGTDHTFIDSSLVNPSDTITRQWVVKDGTNTDVTADTDIITVTSGAVGSTLPTGGGSQSITFRFKAVDNYSIELHIYSTNQTASYETAQPLSVIEMWNIGAVMIDPSYNTSNAPMVTAGDHTPALEEILKNKYDATIFKGFPNQAKLNARVPVMQIAHGAITAFTDLGAGSYRITIGSELSQSSPRIGTDYFYYQGYPYEIKAFAEMGDTDFTIEDTFGHGAPSAAWEGESCWGFGPLANSWIVKLEHRTAAGESTTQQTYWKEIYANNIQGYDTALNSKPLYAEFPDLNFGGQLQATIWRRLGNILSSPSAINIIAATPSGSAATMTSISSVNASGGHVQAQWAGSNAIMYEIWQRHFSSIEGSWPVNSGPQDGGGYYDMYIDLGQDDQPSDPGAGEDQLLIYNGYPYDLDHALWADQGSGIWKVRFTAPTGSPTPTTWTGNNVEIVNHNQIVDDYDTAEIVHRTPNKNAIIPFESGFGSKLAIEIRAIDKYGRVSTEISYFIV